MVERYFSHWKSWVSQAVTVLAIFGVLAPTVRANERVLSCKATSSGSSEITRLASSLNEITREVNEAPASGEDSLAKEFRQVFERRFGIVEIHLKVAKSHYLSRPFFRRCNLTDEELVAIADYTGIHYDEINQALRAGSAQLQDLNPYVKMLNRALSKLDNFEGMVHRGVKLPPSALEEHQVGSVVTYPAFTSASALEGFPGQHQFHIRSKTGKPIEGYSTNTDEREVLFRAGTSFRVLERKDLEDGGVDFVMEEVVEDDGSALDPASAAITVDVKPQDYKKLVK